MARLSPLALTLCLLALPARADVAEAVADHILPGHDRFAAATVALVDAVGKTCARDAIQPAFHAAFDAWMGVQHIRIGPVEEEGRGLAIAFWPDPKGLGLKAQKALLAGDPAKLAPTAFAEQSVAARGLTGLERLIFTNELETEDLGRDTCPLIRATAHDLARIAAEMRAGWQGEFAAVLQSAGAPGNTRFLSQTEARQALFTQLVTGLEHLRDHRLGRPMGTFDRPTPERAEARASGRSLQNVILSLQGMRGLSQSLAAPEAAPETLAAFDRAEALARDLHDPVFAGVATPQGRLRVEVVQQAVDQVRLAALAEIGPALGVGLGFNSLDGD